MQMKPHIFMSYSRREVGFIDDLTHRLEKEGFKVWLDYRSLVPGTPWAGQITKGLDEAEVILLVVSKESIASKYVELEWRRVLQETEKRVILVIFEAVDLPRELEVFEWVDFRGDYESALKELTERIHSSSEKKSTVPEKGFKVPAVVWWSSAVSVVTAILSLYAWWTILLPWLLVPLPYRIFKRDFNYKQVQTALWMLPIGIFAKVMNDVAMSTNTDTVRQIPPVIPFLLTLIFCPWLSFLLRSNGMQRWGKPSAIKVAFANLHRPNNPRPTPIPFFIDHAPEDLPFANDLRKTLVKYGHSQAADIKSAKAVLALLSSYKTDTEADPEGQVVYPVLVQTANPSEKLSKIQWIDLRAGLANADAIAQLLPDPAELLKSLGVRPAGNQLVLPAVINAAVNFLVMFMVFLFGGFILDNLSNNPPPLFLFFEVILLGLIAFLIYRTVQALIRRRGRQASFMGSFFSYIGLGILYIPLYGLVWVDLFVRFGENVPDAIMNRVGVDVRVSLLMTMLAYMYLIGGLILGGYAWLRLRDLRRWFPAKAKRDS
jgi:hypothetical protein